MPPESTLEIPEAPETLENIETPIGDVEAAIAEKPAAEPQESKDEKPAADTKAPIDFEAFRREIDDTLEEAAPQQKPAEKPAGKPEGFDYSGYTANETHLLKNMSRPSREWVVAMLKERKETNQKLRQANEERESLAKLNPTFYESADGYRITPEFASLQETSDLASRIVTHWEEQIMKADAGEDFQDLEFDPKTKKLFLGEKKEATPENRRDLRRHLRFAEQQLARAEHDANEFIGKFQSKQKENQAAIEGLEKRFFPQFEDADYKGWELANALLTVFKKTGHDKSPFARALAKSVALNTLMVEYIKSNNVGAANKEKLAEDAKLAGPGTSKAASAEKGKGANITMEDFEKELN
jgi:hypothetical protein